MKKQYAKIGMALMLLSLLAACKKENSPGSSTPALPVAPTLSLTADTAWFGGTSKITISTNAQSVTLNSQAVTGSVTLTDLKSDSTVTFIAQNTNATGTTTTTKSITVKVWTKEMTFLSSYGSWKVLKSETQTPAGEGIYKLRNLNDCEYDDLNYFQTNNRFFINWGANKCNPELGDTGQGDWNLVYGDPSGDIQMYWVGQTWTVNTLTQDSLVIVLKVHNSLGGFSNMKSTYLH